MRANRPVCGAHAAVLRELVPPAAAHHVVDGGHEACVPVLAVAVASQDVWEDWPEGLEKVAVARCESWEDDGKGRV